ncbi:hypothetical protein BGZ83_010322, partial [Gryganskiella cystojenkinii]
MATAAPLTKLTEFVRRPSVGISGKKVQVLTNFFEVTRLPQATIHHYDVIITPEVPPSVNRRVFGQFVEQYRISDLQDIRPVFDGRRNMFAPMALPFDSRTLEVVLAVDVNLRNRAGAPSFKIKIKKAAEIQLEELGRFLLGRTALSNNCLTSIMALDVLIRHEPAMLYETVGRSFYTPHGSQLLAGGTEVWRGFYQSMRPTPGKMMVNLDVSASTFFQSGSLIEIVVKILGLRTVDDLRRSTALNWVRVERALKGLRIQGTHRERSSKSFKIFGLTKTAAKDTMFSQRSEEQPGGVGGGGGGTGGARGPPASGSTGGPKFSQQVAVDAIKIDVVAYFKQAYNYALQFPMLPCIIVGKTAMLPMEVCTLVQGQRYVRKLDERQTADMIKFTQKKPLDRANSIKDGLQILKYDANDFLANFGLKVASEMAVLQARVLAPPLIHYNPASHGYSFTPQGGDWNLMGRKVLRGGRLASWGVIIFATEREVPRAQISGFIREISVTCTDTGMEVPNKSPPVIYENPHGNIENSMRSIWTKAGNAAQLIPQLLMCILPNTGVQLYAEIKRVTDTVLGVSSQCIQMRQTRDAKKQYCAN